MSNKDSTNHKDIKDNSLRVISLPNSSAKDIYDIVKIASLEHGFKTPSVRNVGRTAPYMHNGVFNTLDEVMDFYEKGGGRGLGLKINNQTLPFDKLELTGNERADIIAFMKSLESR